MSKWKLGAAAAAVVALLAAGFLLALSLTGEKEDPIETAVLDFEGTLADIGELTTAEYGYTLTQITDKEALTVLGLHIPFTSSKVIYSYSGQVKAGFEFQEIQVTVDEAARQIQVQLPEAKILSSEVDFESFQVYDERNSVFNPLTAEDFNQGLVDFQNTGETEAIDHGLLDRARENAEHLLSGTLAGYFDLEEYSVVFA